MDATGLYREGKLADAIEAQLQAVKSDPADHGKRLFLFELLAFAGDWDRARRQVDVVQYDDLELETATQAYRALLDAEQARHRLFAEGIRPQFLADLPPHVDLRLQALDCLRAGQPAETSKLLHQADAAAPSIRGQLNGKPFELLRDCDDLFGPVLEVMARGSYFWVPLEQVELVSINAPRFPRDLIWLPAHLEMTASRGDVFLPVRYPDSPQHPDPAVRLGRATEWKGTDNQPVRGFGQRTFLVNDDGVGLLEWRELQIALQE